MTFRFGKNGGKVVPHVSHLIDVATDGGSQASENWTLFMEICDVINSSEEGLKDAVKTMRKRFATKHPPTITLTLALIETCVKNCGKRFHIHIATKDFLQDFIKIISPKYNPSIDLQMNVLGLLQTWAYAFQSSPELKEVCKQYQELKTKGVEFPPLDVDKATQAHIPFKVTPTVAVTDGRSGINRTHNSLSPTGQQNLSRSAPAGGMPMMRPPQAPVQGQGQGGTLTPDHFAKLQSELNTVQQNCQVFGDMLTELTPGQENSSDMELLEDLNMTCRQMQKRIMELIQVVQVDQVTDELLTVNDQLNNVFLRYDRYQRLQSNQTSAAAQPAGEFPCPPAYPAYPASSPSPAVHSTNKSISPSATRSPEQQQTTPGSVAVDNLIDLGDTPTPKPRTHRPALDSQFVNLSLSDSSNMGGSEGLFANTEDFDMFASSRQQQQQTAATSRPVAGAESTEILGRPDDFAEMEKWLMENPGSAVNDTTATSSEFERFLSERANEVDHLPPIKPASSSSNQGQGSRHRELTKEDDAPLFSL